MELAESGHAGENILAATAGNLRISGRAVPSAHESLRLLRRGAAL
jgi:hypothetical protein